MPAPSQMATIVCPKCGQTLPVRAQICQFCKTDVRAVPRGLNQPYTPSNVASETNWKVVMYYVMGVWWVLNGTLIALASAKIMSALMAGPGAMFGGIPIIGIVIGIIYALVGAGLLIKVELARGIVNVLSWITIGMGLFSVAGYLFAGFVMGPKVFIPIFKAFLDMGLAGFQIYLIAETDKFM